MGLIWHDRDRTVPWVDKIDKMVDKFYELYPCPRQQSMKWKKAVEDFGKFSKLKCDFSLKRIQEGDMDFIIERFTSLSSVASSSIEERKRLVSHIHTVLGDTGKTLFALPQIVSIYWLAKK